MIPSVVLLLLLLLLRMMMMMICQGALEAKVQDVSMCLARVKKEVRRTGHPTARLTGIAWCLSHSLPSLSVTPPSLAAFTHRGGRGSTWRSLASVSYSLRFLGTSVRGADAAGLAGHDRAAEAGHQGLPGRGRPRQGALRQVEGPPQGMEHNPFRVDDLYAVILV
jgi:hypothetical protein